MDAYCERDVEVTIKIFELLMGEWLQLYRVPFTPIDAFKCGQKAFFLMSCQELTGWKFDTNLAESLKLRIIQMMEDIRAEVEPQLPPRALKKSEEKSYTMPAKPFKKNGEFSTTWNNFVEKHGGVDAETGMWEFYGVKYPIQAGLMLDIKLPMEMANQDQMKDFFIDSGWKPTLFNFQKDSNGKPVRDSKGKLIPTSPKIQEAQKICPNLEKMEGPLVKLVVNFLLFISLT
jgi:hypothetical protein